MYAVGVNMISPSVTASIAPCGMLNFFIALAKSHQSNFCNTVHSVTLRFKVRLFIKTLLENLKEKNVIETEVLIIGFAL